MKNRGEDLIRYYLQKLNQINIDNEKQCIALYCFFFRKGMFN
jgi:hypothetical protein